MAEVTACSYMPNTCTWNSQAVGTTVDFNYSISASTEMTFQSESGGAVLKYSCADFIADWTLTCRDLTNVPAINCNTGNWLFNSSASLVVSSEDIFGGNDITYTFAAAFISGSGVSITRTDGTATISGKAIFGASGAAPVVRAQAA